MVNKYHFNISIGTTTHNAGNKAVNDCRDILLKRGYQDLELTFNKKTHLIAFNLIKLLLALTKGFFLIKRKSIIIAQYPLLGVNSYFYKFIKLLQNKNCFVACIIHDLESLRFNKSNTLVAKEIFNLNAYNVVISHNAKMTAWLSENGLKTQIIDLEIFDYLDTKPTHENQHASADKKNNVVFAGSLTRGKFLYKLKDLAGVIKFKLYGSLTDVTIADNKKVFFEGSFPPDNLLDKLSGGFGLIWDGDEIFDCEGQFGDYIRYNNPHKLSLYVAAKLPVILPSKAALAPFVTKNNIGFTISSLVEIAEKISNLNDGQYEKMCENLESLSAKVKDGYFFNSAINSIEKLASLAYHKN